MTDNKPAQTPNFSDAVATSADISAYLSDIRQRRSGDVGSGTGRLIFAFDATASRQETWDAACQLQAEMFREVSRVGAGGTLNIQLLYYRGISECKASGWTSRSDKLLRLMESILCHAGRTQIGKVLAHAKKETQLLKVAAVVFVGDAMEEKLDDLCHAAGALGLLGVPAFMFQEGHDAITEQAFREIARLTRGAYCRFDPGAAHQLAELLRAVAAYAAGGLRALTDLSARRQAGAIKLLEQMRT